MFEQTVVVCDTFVDVGFEAHARPVGQFSVRSEPRDQRRERHSNGSGEHLLYEQSGPEYCESHSHWLSVLHLPCPLHSRGQPAEIM